MKKIAFLATDDFEDDELKIPYEKLKELGYKVVLVGTSQGKEITGKRRRAAYVTDLSVESVKVDDFDAVVIPGGYSPDRLRLNKQMVEFVKDFYKTYKPIAAICHGPQLLISAGVIRDHKITGWPSIVVDIKNAGGRYVDQAVVIDRNIISSRKPADIPQFIDAIISELDKTDKEQISA